MSTIPGNKLQQFLHNKAREAKRPGVSGTNSIAVVIVQVYDTDVVTQDGLDDKLSTKMLTKPGTMLAKVVMIRTGRELLVPFKHSEAHVLSVHGNSAMLEGMHGVVEYTGMHPESGVLIVTGNPNESLVGLNSRSVVFDISGVI